GKSVKRRAARPDVPKDPDPPFQTDAPLLQVRDLQTKLLKPLSFSLAGECIAVRGPSGAGKTLLLRAIADLDPNQGSVRLEGGDRSTIPGRGWRRLVGYLPAEPAGGRKRSVSISVIGPRPPLFLQIWGFLRKRRAGRSHVCPPASGCGLRSSVP